MDTATPLWACLDFPDLAGQAAFAEHYDDTAPHALSRPDPRGARIDWLNPAAAAQGVRLEQTASAAFALCPALRLRSRDPATEQRQLLALAAWAYCYSAQVCVLPPSRLLLEIGASRRLFGGLVQLLQRMALELAGQAQTVLACIAPNPTAAHVLGRVAAPPALGKALKGDGRRGTAADQGGEWRAASPTPYLVIEDEAGLRRLLDGLPIDAAGLPEEAVALLLGSGFRRLAEVDALPRAELSRRIGPAALLHLDWLHGRALERRSCWQPPDRYEQAIELEAPAHSSQALLFPLRRLLQELALHLAAREGGVQDFVLRLVNTRRPATRLPVGLLAPRRDAAGLFELARMQLERCQLPAEVVSLALIAERLPSLRPVHRDLFEPARNEAQSWAELAERLRARLGPEALRAITSRADHRPELAHRDQRLAATTASSRKAAGHPVAGDPPPPGERPLWLLPRPLPLRQPLSRVLAGPERIESGWWDGGDTRRDYYIVLCRNGQRAWVFAAPGVRDEFMLHGWFA